LFQQYFENAINDPNAPMTTSDVKVTLEKKMAPGLLSSTMNF